MKRHQGLLTQCRALRECPRRTQFATALVIYPFVVSALLLGVVAWTEWVGLQALLLYFAVTFFLIGVLRGAVLTRWPFPEPVAKRLTGSIGFVVASVFYLLNGEAAAGIVVAWVFLLLGVVTFWTHLQRGLLDFVWIRELLKAYEKKELPDLPVPFVYVLCEVGPASVLGHRLSSRLTHSLWKYRYLPAGRWLFEDPGARQGAGLRARRWQNRFRMSLLVCVSDSLRDRSSEFRKWVARHAAALLVVRTVPLDVHEDVQFETEVQDGLQLCPGPTIDIGITLPGRPPPSGVRSGDSTAIVEWRLRGNALDDALAPLNDSLARTAIPLTWTDDRMPSNLRGEIHRMAETGVPPFADSYLRFRQARSDVERFVALLDAIECLTKLSCCVLLVGSWVRGEASATSTKLLTLMDNPTKPFGAWIKLLEQLVGLQGDTPIECQWGSFWEGRASGVTEELLAAVGAAGLVVSAPRGRSWLHWLRWAKDLRNVTKGHGVLEESSIEPLVHGLHESTLALSASFHPVDRAFTFSAMTNDGGLFPLRGWLRGDRRFHCCPISVHDAQDTMAVLEVDGEEVVSLHPLVLVRAGQVWIWEGLGSDELTDYFNFGAFERLRMLRNEVGRAGSRSLYEAWQATSAVARGPNAMM